MDEFWDAETNTAPRAVDVYMTKLRGKFEACDEFELKTVHGLSTLSRSIPQTGFWTNQLLIFYIFSIR